MFGNVKDVAYGFPFLLVKVMERNGCFSGVLFGQWFSFESFRINMKNYALIVFTTLPFIFQNRILPGSNTRFLECLTSGSLRWVPRMVLWCCRIYNMQKGLSWKVPAKGPEARECTTRSSRGPKSQHPCGPLTTSCDSSSRGSGGPFWPPRALHSYPQIYSLFYRYTLHLKIKVS